MTSTTMFRNFKSGYLSQGAPLGPAAQLAATLTADNQFVVVQGKTLLQLYSNSTTASQRTFTIQDGDFQGHTLHLVFESGSSNTCELANTGNVKLVAAWTPLQYQSLTLYWDGFFWIEQGRSNPSVTSSALADGHLLVGSALGVATDVALSGDATIVNTGALTIANSAVSAAKLASDAVTTVKILAANVTIPKLDAAVMVDLTVALTQAQIITLNSVPVTLLAAPGAGIGYIIDEVEVLHTYSTAVYVGGGDLTLTYGAAGTAILDFDSTLVTAGSSFNGISTPTVYNLDNSTGTATSGLDLSVVTNKALVLQAASADFTLGNAANILKFRIRYHKITLLT